MNINENHTPEHDSTEKNRVHRNHLLIENIKQMNLNKKSQKLNRLN